MIQHEQQKVFSPLTNSATTNAFRFQLFDIVPPDSPVFVACRRGDIAEMRRLFQSREASPYDRDALGASLMDVALAKAWNLIWKNNPKLALAQVSRTFPTKLVKIHSKLSNYVSIVG
jgi:hypothetical protein